jgi:hypothetical protein
VSVAESGTKSREYPVESDRSTRKLAFRSTASHSSRVGVYGFAPSGMGMEMGRCCPCAKTQRINTAKTKMMLVMQLVRR